MTVSTHGMARLDAAGHKAKTTDKPTDKTPEKASKKTPPKPKIDPTYKPDDDLATPSSVDMPIEKRQAKPKPTPKGKVVIEVKSSTVNKGKGKAAVVEGKVTVSKGKGVEKVKGKAGVVKGKGKAAVKGKGKAVGKGKGKAAGKGKGKGKGEEDDDEKIRAQLEREHPPPSAGPEDDFVIDGVGVEGKSEGELAEEETERKIRNAIEGSTYKNLEYVVLGTKAKKAKATGAKTGAKTGGKGKGKVKAKAKAKGKAKAEELEKPKANTGAKVVKSNAVKKNVPACMKGDVHVMVVGI